MSFGDGVTLLPGVTGGRYRWWTHIAKSTNDLSRLARNIFCQSLDLLGWYLGTGWSSSMANRGCSLVYGLAELVEHG